MRPPKTFVAVLAAALCFGFPLLAAADWLVTRDGGRIETRGTWEIKGAQVLFNLPNGTLSSMRLRDVDLDASAVATAEARKPRPAPQATRARKKSSTPVLVLTDEDIKRAVPDEVEDTAGGVAPPPAEAKDLRVASWWRVEDPGAEGVEIQGALRNFGSDFALDLKMTVAVAVEGSEEQKAQAFLDEKDLAPGALTDFRAVFPEITSFTGDPYFDVQHATVTLEPEEPKAKAADGESAADDEDDIEG